MHVGIQIHRFDHNPFKIREDIQKIAQSIEMLGFHSLWLMDHVFQLGNEPFGVVDDPLLEAYTTIGFLAGVTQRIKLGVMVSAVTYREPGYLMKMATTLDILSHGRAYLGLGAGWYEREARGLGLYFPSLKERFERLEEALQIAHRMFNDQKEEYVGSHYHLAEPINRPQPISQPRMPIMIGGGGEKKTLRLVAQYADACNLYGFLSVDQLAHKLDLLRIYCADYGRDYELIEKTMILHVPATERAAEELIQVCQERAPLGFTHAILIIHGLYQRDWFNEFATTIMPVITGL